MMGWAAARCRPIVVTTLAMLPACVREQPYACNESSECSTRSDGRCEPTGYCSYPDDRCASRRRYGDLAGRLADRCVDDDAAGTTTTSAVDSSSTTAMDVAGESSSGESDCTGDCPVPGGEERWSLVLPGPGDGPDTLHAVIVMANGNVAAAGGSFDGDSDVLLVTLTADGELVTRVDHDELGGDDEALALLQGPAGELWVCGRDDEPGNDAPLHAWLARFDAPFVTRSEVHFDLGEHTDCRGLAIATTDTWIAVGEDQDYGGPAWIYAFAPWSAETGSSTMLGTTQGDILAATTRTPAGATFVGGGIAGLGAVFGVVDGVAGAAVLADPATAVVQGLASTDDRIVIGGYTGEVADAWVTARDLDGAELWSWAPEPASQLGDEIEAVAIDSAGNVIAGGFFGVDAPARTVYKLDPAGALRWRVQWPVVAAGADHVRGVAVLPDDEIVVVGDVTSDAGDLEAWIARIGP